MRQILRISIPVELYCQKEERINQMVRRACFNKNHIIGYVKGASYSKKALDTKVAKKALVRALSQPTSFDAPDFFLSFMFVEHCNAKKLLVLAHRVKAGTYISFSVLHGLAAWGACSKRPEVETGPNEFQAFNL